MNIEERFLKYVSYDTQSDEYSSTTPSTLKQLELGKELVKEMLEIGIDDAHLDEYGIVYGTIKGNGGTGDIIGFIAHMDTSPDASGKDIKPQKITNYDGSIIELNKELGLSLNPKEFTSLKKMIGHDLITTDGTTLLGADDKAGVAIIMDLADYLYHHPEIKHNDIKIAFTPDEEVGRGTDNFDVKKFNAKYAYTVDGGDIAEYNYENFNAYSAEIEITGKSIHPGNAKNKMVSAINLAIEFENMLPEDKKPYYTDGYDGFNHLHHLEGNCEKAKLEYIIRNHDLQLAIGNSIVRSEGYDLLINLFSKDYNTFVFVCFPISTFPKEYHEKIREELEKAIRFYAGRMEHDEYRLSSFEQVSNINRLLMENYKEYGKNE